MAPGSESHRAGPTWPRLESYCDVNVRDSLRARRRREVSRGTDRYNLRMPPETSSSVPSFRNQPLLTPDELKARLGEFYKAVEEFNDRYYFESHETLEDLWMV